MALLLIFFESSRGLWHGDLLFPLLFIFVIETHSKMLIRAITAAISLVVSGGASRGIMVISSLLFANDTSFSMIVMLNNS